MKAKLILIASLMIYGGYSHAGFKCEAQEDGLLVVAQHELPDVFSEGESGELKILTDNGEEIQMSLLVSKRFSRLDVGYDYQLPVEGVIFSVEESSGVFTPPGCHPGGRMTCDFDWNAQSTYIGHLTLNGKNHDLDCKAN